MKKPKIYDPFIVLHSDEDEVAVNINSIESISRQKEGATVSLRDELLDVDEDFDDILEAIGED